MTVGDDDAEIRVECAELRLEHIATRAGGLEHWDPGGEGPLFHRRRDEGRMRAALRSIGLCHHRTDLDTRLEEGFQTGNREGRRPEEDDPHQSAAFDSSGRGVRVRGSPA